MANAWDRQEDKGEGVKAYAAFCAYRDLAPHKRSVLAAYISLRKPPTSPKQAPGWWKDLSEQWDWPKRVAAYDAEQQRIDDELRKAERAKVMAFRYANDYERVKALDELAANLLEMTKDESKVWLPDIKVVGFGQQQQVVDIVRFNAPLFDQTRGTLGDIAAEKSERIKTTKIKFDPTTMTDAELAAFIQARTGRSGEGDSGSGTP